MNEKGERRKDYFDTRNAHIPLLSIENVIWRNKLPHRMQKGHDNR